MSDDSGRVDFYDYDLPPHLIASHPPKVRGESRLMVADPASDSIALSQFDQLGNFLNHGDLLVFNDVRVIRARIYAQKETGGQVELFVTDVVESTDIGATLRCMTRSSKPIRPGKLRVGELVVEVEAAASGMATVRIPIPLEPFLETYGNMPLPPYILRQRKLAGDALSVPEDADRYQTVYAAEGSAVAAPTAGLHFTTSLLAELKSRGVDTAQITLDVGPGTFKPVTAETLDEHDMHRESYTIGDALRGQIAAARKRGGRVIAVGTTTARTLEAEAQKDDPFVPGRYSTDIFIRPGFEWQVCDGLITNFHLPKSTLLALVYSFAGADFARRIYARAIEESLRFYSYGDAMFFESRR